MEQRGTLKSWNDQKGFGFIRPEQGGEMFAHISAVHERRPLVGDRVLYVRARSSGRLRAEHVRLDAPLTLDQPAIQRPARALDGKAGQSLRGG